MENHSNGRKRSHFTYDLVEQTKQHELILCPISTIRFTLQYRYFLYLTLQTQRMSYLLLNCWLNNQKFTYLHKGVNLLLIESRK